VPGLPIKYCNDAFTRLTGWRNEEATGRNCRFLQGPHTEADVLAQVIAAVRIGSPASVQITNHRKSGSPFVTSLSLHPVRDSNGVYRFNVGVLVDAASMREWSEKADSVAAIAARTSLDKLRTKMPVSFDAQIEPQLPHEFTPMIHLISGRTSSPARASSLACCGL